MLRLLICLALITHLTFIYAEDDKPKESRDNELILTPNPLWKEKETGLYRTPTSATKGVKGTTIPYTFWYDHFAWDESTPLNEHAEKSFKHKDDGAFAIIVSDKKQFSIDDLDDIVIKNAKESGFEHAQIVSDERRNVNGKDVLFIHWKAILQGINVDFLSYVYSGDEGSIFIHTYTPTFLFKKNQRDMEAFLNGFTLETK